MAWDFGRIFRVPPRGHGLQSNIQGVLLCSGFESNVQGAMLIRALQKIIHFVRSDNSDVVRDSGRMVKYHVVVRDSGVMFRVLSCGQEIRLNNRTNNEIGFSIAFEDSISCLQGLA